MASRLINTGAKKLEKAPEDDPATTKPQVEQQAFPEIPQAEDSEKASHSASGNAGEKPPAKRGPGRPRGSKKTARTAKPGPPPERRVGRPRGPKRVALNVRILEETNAMVTEAVAATGQSPQYVVEAALTLYFKKLGIRPPAQRGREGG